MNRLLQDWRKTNANSNLYCCWYCGRGEHSRCAGITDIETNVGGEVQRSKFRNITLSLSADKLNLTKGESRELRIVVGGLEQLQAPATMTIDASGAIYMGGGNSQKLTIEPAAVNADGTYRKGEFRE